MFTRHLRALARSLPLLAGLLLLSACAPPKRPAGFTPIGGSSPLLAAQAPVPPAAAPETAAPAPLPSPAPVLSLPPVEPELPARPVEVPPGVTPLPEPREAGLQIPFGVVPVPVWWQLCGFSELRVTHEAAPQSLELHTDGGILSLTLGERYARWNGINIALGFPPVLKDGQVALHSLDVNKNLYPLAHQDRQAWQPTRRVLVIDPGHGGGSPGAKVTGRNLYEKDLTLDWALRIEKLLEQSPSGWQVVLTRRDDRDLGLMERVAIADAHQADLFISLHFNSLEGSAAGTESGLETYCLTPAGMPSNISRAGIEDDPASVYPNNAYDRENLLLAVRLHESLIQGTARPDRGVRRARFMTVLREQKRPAVLLEGGFLSNPAEARLILEPAYRQQLAEAVVAALPQ